MAIHSAVTKSTIRTGVQDRTEFSINKGSMSAKYIPSFNNGWDRLPLWAAELLHEQAIDGAFVVYSYSTPIAWHTEAHGWYVCNARHSATTTNHQHHVRMALIGIDHTTPIPN